MKCYRFVLGLSILPGLFLCGPSGGELSAQGIFFGSPQFYTGALHSSAGAIAVGDFNGDGFSDVAEGTSGDSLRILLGTGDGKLAAEGTPIAAGGVALDIATGDLNRDGKLDLVVNYWPVPGFTAFLGDGRGRFPIRLDQALPVSRYQTLGDMNGDGILDLIYSISVFAPSRSGIVGVFLGKGDGTFTRRLEVPTTEMVQSHPIVFDSNGDKIPDVVVISEDGTLFQLVGIGDGSLRVAGTTPVGGTTPGAQFVAGDFDRDGRFDLAVLDGNLVSTNPTVKVLLGRGAGGFQPAVRYPMRYVFGYPVYLEGIASGDIDADGILDLLVLTRPQSLPQDVEARRKTIMESAATTLIGRGDGTFFEVRNQIDLGAQVNGGFPGFPRRVFLSDFNGDRKLDIIVSHSVGFRPESTGICLVINKTSKTTIYGVFNAASFTEAALSPGEMVVIYGRNVGPPIPASMEISSDGIAAKFRSGTQVAFNGRLAPIFYASKDAVYALVPYDVSDNFVRSVSIVAEFQGERSVPYSLPLARSMPGVFTANSSGTGQLLAVNLDDGRLNSVTNPARKGSLVTLFVTGEGQTTPRGIDGKVPSDVPLPTPELPVVVGINNVGAEILYAGGAPGLVAGILQINLRVPEDVPSGPSIPIVVKVGDAYSQAGVTIAVQ
ncbi:MAG: VCBS repeat-containing protein [Bryobacterales bacterium]|nr:VCBS repeat-containing protein [Bryobacterales bacterium]